MGNFLRKYDFQHSFQNGVFIISLAAAPSSKLLTETTTDGRVGSALPSSAQVALSRGDPMDSSGASWLEQPTPPPRPPLEPPPNLYSPNSFPSVKESADSLSFLELCKDKINKSKNKLKSLNEKERDREEMLDAINVSRAIQVSMEQPERPGEDSREAALALKRCIEESLETTKGQERLREDSEPADCDLQAILQGSMEDEESGRREKSKSELENEMGQAIEYSKIEEENRRDECDDSKLAYEMELAMELSKKEAEQNNCRNKERRNEDVRNNDDETFSHEIAAAIEQSKKEAEQNRGRNRNKDGGIGEDFSHEIELAMELSKKEAEQSNDRNNSGGNEDIVSHEIAAAIEESKKMALRTRSDSELESLVAHVMQLSKKEEENRRHGQKGGSPPDPSCT